MQKMPLLTLLGSKVEEESTRSESGGIALMDMSSSAPFLPPIAGLRVSKATSGIGGDNNNITNGNNAKSGRFLERFAFLMLGIGVALPWVSLRTGVAFFGARFGAQWFVLLYAVYYAAQLAMLVLQSLFDTNIDLIFGTHSTYTTRLSVSLTILVVVQIALPYASATPAASLAVGTTVGLFDAVAFGAAAQLFSTHAPALGSAYFMGSSLASVVAIVAAHVTGFDALRASDAPSDGTAPLPLGYFYFSAAAVSGIALLAVLCLLFSVSGMAHLELIDSELLDASPSSPRAVSRRAPLEFAAQWGLLEDRTFAINGGGADDVGGLLAKRMLISRIIHDARYYLLAMMLLWSSTTLCDSLISFQPAATDSPSGVDAGFKLKLLYASLGGEVFGKIFLLMVPETRRGGEVQAKKSGGGGGGGAETDSESLEGDDFLSGSGSGSGSGEGDTREAQDQELDLPMPAAVLGRVPTWGCGFSTQALVLTASALRFALLAIPLLFYAMQHKLPGAPLRGTLFPGWIFSDAALLSLQAIFDCTGAFLSSLTYALAPSVLANNAAARARGSALLSVALIIGSTIGLGGALGSSYWLGASAAQI